MTFNIINLETWDRKNILIIISINKQLTVLLKNLISLYLKV